MISWKQFVPVPVRMADPDYFFILKIHGRKKQVSAIREPISYVRYSQKNDLSCFGPEVPRASLILIELLITDLFWDVTHEQCATLFFKSSLCWKWIYPQAINKSVSRARYISGRVLIPEPELTDCETSWLSVWLFLTTSARGKEFQPVISKTQIRIPHFFKPSISSKKVFLQ